MFKRVTSLFFVLCWISITQAADMVVLRSTSPAFSVGQALTQQAEFQLIEQQQVSVMFGSGQVRTISAPFKGHLVEPLPHLADSQHVAMLASALQVLNQRNQQTTRSALEQPDDVWAVNVVDNERHYCVATQPIRLWRPSEESQRASQVHIRHKPTGETAKLMWPAKKTKLQWPRNFPVLYGDTYTVENKNARGHASFKKLILHQLPHSLPSASHKVVWMVGRGCIPQANRLLAQLR